MVVDVGIKRILFDNCSIAPNTLIIIARMYIFPYPAAAFKLFTDITTSMGSQTLQLGMHRRNLKHSV